ncbi:hypothetical protein JCM5350_005058 [Sporobolomyces pararoseus]
MSTARFSFTRTDISELDIEYLLENNISLAQVLPEAQIDTYSPPHSPVDGAFDDLPALSPSSNAPSSLPYFDSSPYSDSPDTPLASRRQYQTPTLTRSPRTDALSSYSFPPHEIPSSPSHSRSSTPTPTTPVTSPSLQSSFPLPLPKFAQPVTARSSTIMVELDDFFPHKPSNTFTPFPSFSAQKSTLTTTMNHPNIDQGRKGSLASSFFSTTSSTSSSSSSSVYSSDSGSTRTRTRTRSRSISGKSVKSTGASTVQGGGRGGGGMEFGEIRQPKLAAYPRYVPPKPEGTVGRKLKLFGGGR